MATDKGTIKVLEELKDALKQLGLDRSNKKFRVLSDHIKEQKKQPSVHTYDKK